MKFFFKKILKVRNISNFFKICIQKNQNISKKIFPAKNETLGKVEFFLYDVHKKLYIFISISFKILFISKYCNV